MVYFLNLVITLLTWFFTNLITSSSLGLNFKAFVNSVSYFATIFLLFSIEQFSLGCVIENNKKIVAKYETELTNALKFKPKEDDVIRFVKNHVNRVITKFKK